MHTLGQAIAMPHANGGAGQLLYAGSISGLGRPRSQ